MSCKINCGPVKMLSYKPCSLVDFPTNFEAFPPWSKVKTGGHTHRMFKNNQEPSTIREPHKWARFLGQFLWEIPKCQPLYDRSVQGFLEGYKLPTTSEVRPCSFHLLLFLRSLVVFGIFINVNFNMLSRRHNNRLRQRFFFFFSKTKFKNT